MKCPVCLKSASLCCGRCRSVYYCSKEHQKQAWPSHKLVCPTLGTTTTTTTATQPTTSIFFSSPSCAQTPPPYIPASASHLTSSSSSAPPYNPYPFTVDSFHTTCSASFSSTTTPLPGQIGPPPTTRGASASSSAFLLDQIDSKTDVDAFACCIVYMAEMTQAEIFMPGYHVRMLNDTERNKKYKAAITRAVRDGGKDVTVLDIGSGTGLLSLYALEAGANRVFSVECESDINKACTHLRTLLKPAYANKWTVISKMSTEVTKEDMFGCVADVVVSEMLTADGLGENIAHIFWDVLRRGLVVNGAVFIPNELEFSIQPVCSPALRLSSRCANLPVALVPPVVQRLLLPKSAYVDGLQIADQLVTLAPPTVVGSYIFPCSKKDTPATARHMKKSIVIPLAEHKGGNNQHTANANMNVLDGWVVRWRAKLYKEIEILCDDGAVWENCFVPLALIAEGGSSPPFYSGSLFSLNKVSKLNVQVQLANLGQIKRGRLMGEDTTVSAPQAVVIALNVSAPPAPVRSLCAVDMLRIGFPALGHILLHHMDELFNAASHMEMMWNTIAGSLTGIRAVVDLSGWLYPGLHLASRVSGPVFIFLAKEIPLVPTPSMWPKNVVFITDEEQPMGCLRSPAVLDALSGGDVLIFTAPLLRAPTTGKPGTTSLDTEQLLAWRAAISIAHTCKHIVVLPSALRVDATPVRLKPLHYQNRRTAARGMFIHPPSIPNPSKLFAGNTNLGTVLKDMTGDQFSNGRVRAHQALISVSLDAEEIGTTQPLWQSTDSHLEMADLSCEAPGKCRDGLLGIVLTCCIRVNDAWFGDTRPLANCLDFATPPFTRWFVAARTSEEVKTSPGKAGSTPASQLLVLGAGDVGLDDRFVSTCCGAVVVNEYFP